MTKKTDGVVMASASEASLDVEFAYTPWRGSCRDLYTIDQACRRPGGHAGEHASGYGPARVRWR